MELTAFLHVPFETPRHVGVWARKRGFEFRVVRLFAGEKMPPVHDMEGLVVMGGPMGVGDAAAYPWLRTEKACIQAMIEAEKPVFGVCLGAQLIAEALGGSVYPNPAKEIGWYPVRFEAGVSGRTSLLPAVETDTLEVLHWHGDTFSLPPGAVHLAATPACRHQAFAWKNRVLGLQFHLEMTPDGVAEIVEQCAEELKSESPFIQSAAEILQARPDYARMHGLLEGMLDRLFAK